MYRIMYIIFFVAVVHGHGQSIDKSIGDKIFLVLKNASSISVYATTSIQSKVMDSLKAGSIVRVNRIYKSLSGEVWFLTQNGWLPKTNQVSVLNTNALQKQLYSFGLTGSFFHGSSHDLNRLRREIASKKDLWILRDRKIKYIEFINNFPQLGLYRGYSDGLQVSFEGVVFEVIKKNLNELQLMVFGVNIGPGFISAMDLMGDDYMMFENGKQTSFVVNISKVNARTIIVNGVQYIKGK